MKKWIINHRKRLALLGALPVLLISGAAMALVAADFLPEAQAYLNKNCKAGVKNADAAICYVFYHQQEQDQQVAQLQQQVSGLQVGAGLSLYTEQGQKLGALVTYVPNSLPNNSFYYSPVNRVVQINAPFPSSGIAIYGQPTALSYESSDCTGAPYKTGVTNNYGNVSNQRNSVFAFGPRKFYVADRAIYEQKAVASVDVYSYQTNSSTCQPNDPTPQTAISLTETAWPFTEPVSGILVRP